MSLSVYRLVGTCVKSWFHHLVPGKHCRRRSQNCASSAKIVIQTEQNPVAFASSMTISAFAPSETDRFARVATRQASRRLSHLKSLASG